MSDVEAFYDHVKDTWRNALLTQAAAGTVNVGAMMEQLLNHLFEVRVGQERNGDLLNVADAQELKPLLQEELARVKSTITKSTDQAFYPRSFVLETHGQKRTRRIVVSSGSHSLDKQQISRYEKLLNNCLNSAETFIQQADQVRSSQQAITTEILAFVPELLKIVEEVIK